MRVLPSILFATGVLAAALARDDASKPDIAPRTTAPPATATADIFGRSGAGLILARGVTTGPECLSTGLTKTKSCDVQTADGSEVTGECRTTDVETSTCSPGKTCTMDSSGQDVCMDLQNTLDVAGIVISIAFGVIIALGIATLTFLCCRDRKEQKRLAAKAEATALARAATKKKRQQEQRTPLMQERRRDASTGPTDPFHDRNRS